MRMRWLAVLNLLAISPAGFGAFRADAMLVLVPVTVTDKGATVTGLERRRFTLLEDNVPQRVELFAQKDVPCSVG